MYCTKEMLQFKHRPYSLSYELVEWSKSIPRIWISHIGQEVKQMEEAIWTFTVGWLVVMVAIGVAYLTIYLGR